MAVRHRPAVLLVASLTAVMLACNGSGLQTPVSVPATPGPTDVLTNPTEAVVAPTEAAPDPAAEPLVVTHQDSAFYIHSLDGAQVETRPADGLSYARPNTAQVVGDTIYHVAGGGAEPGEVVRRVTSSETTDLEFTRSDQPFGLTFAISGDGSQIAWAQTSYVNGPPFSQLWVAGIDGANPRLVTQTEDADDIPEFFVLEPVTWLPDGSLVYAWQVTGIGGYILFFGWSSLYRWDAASGAVTPLAAVTPEVGAPCWTDVTPQATFALGACGDANEVVERDTASGAVTIFPLLPEQGQAGAAAYSPEPGRLVYGIARGDPDNEAGQLVLIMGSGQAPTALASQTSGAFDWIEWIDGERLVASYWQGSGLAASFVDLIGLDGSRSPIGQGRLVGLMRR